jgi:hypothetical protein
VDENGFTNSYQSVKRFCAQAASGPARADLAFWNASQEKTQLDFGLGAPIGTAKERSAVVGSCGWH